MSFATDLKDELCKDVPEQESAIHALLYGFLLFSHKFSADEISFSVGIHTLILLVLPCLWTYL